MIDPSMTKIMFDFEAGDEETEIYENLIVLFTTPVGTVPFDRDFGIDFRVLDQPIPVARNKYSIELTEKVQKYEPRVLVQNMTFETEPLTGRLYPRVALCLT